MAFACAVEPGSSSETVTEKTGVFFREQTVDALAEAVIKIESGAVRPLESDCRSRAAEFSRARFQGELATLIRDAWIVAGKDPRALI